MNVTKEEAFPTRLKSRTRIGISVHPNSSPKAGMKVGCPPRRTSRDTSIQAASSIDENSPIDDFADRPAPTSPRRVSHDESIQTASSIDKTKPVDDFSSHPTPMRKLKSCISAPNLSGMATMKRNVSFSKIEIREYERTLGDNPCVSSGPPLALDWNYNPNHNVFDLEEYEDAKTPRSKMEMLMPKAVRETMLKDQWDVSRSEMNTVAREVNITKRNRRATAQSSSATEKRREQLEKASKKMKRLISLGKKRDEQRLWKDVKTVCGKRVYSMNDLAAYNATVSVGDTSDSTETKDVAKKGGFVSEESLSSSGNESATSLPVVTLDDDDDWGFGFDDDDYDEN